MPSNLSPNTKVQVTPRQLLAFSQIGTGENFSVHKYRAFLRQHGSVVAREIRRMIQEFTGFTPTELHQIAPEMAGSKTVAAEEVRDKIRNRLMEKLKQTVSGLHQLRDSADDYIRNIIEHYFPNEDSTSMNDEAATPRDPAKLVLRAFNDNMTPKIKFESARKMLLMKMLADISDYHEQPLDDEDALEYMSDFFNEEIIKLKEGEKIGHLHDKFLVSEHEGDELKTTHAELRDTKPETIDPQKNIRVTYLECRRTEIGKDEVFFRKHPRKKSPDSRLTKELRYGTMTGEKDSDRNGIRLVFACKQDWENFFGMFQEKLQQTIARGLIKELEELEELPTTLQNREKIRALKDRINFPKKNVSISDVKDSLDGNGFEGSAAASSCDLKVFKFKLQLSLAYGRIYRYEFQIFLPDGFADYLYRTGVSWEEYNVNRFFQGESGEQVGVDELLFPKDIYNQLNFEKVHEKAIKEAHRKVWNGNGNGRSHPSPEPEREETKGIEPQKC